MLVKFSTLAGGVFIEQTSEPEYGFFDRCFRFAKDGYAEFALYGDLISDAKTNNWTKTLWKESYFEFA